MKLDDLPNFFGINTKTILFAVFVLFGSFARNEQDENSDIDIVLEFHPGTKNIYEKKTNLKKNI